MSNTIDYKGCIFSNSIIESAQLLNKLAEKDNVDIKFSYYANIDRNTFGIWVDYTDPVDVAEFRLRYNL